MNKKQKDIVDQKGSSKKGMQKLKKTTELVEILQQQVCKLKAQLDSIIHSIDETSVPVCKA